MNSVLGTGHSNMNGKKLERAIELGKRVEHFFLALVGANGFPYVNSARQIEQVSDNQFAIDEWICPLTVKHLSENPKMAVLIWDPTADDGYEILDEVLMFESQAFLNGFAPEVEEDAYLPQVKRKLIIRAEKITALSHALRCDNIQLLAERRSIMETKETKDVTAAAATETDAEAECMTECCACCCCETEEECSMEE